jgi:hypothetical protein
MRVRYPRRLDMHALKDFLTTDYGLMSAAVIVITLAMGGYFTWFFRKHIREDLERHQRGQ